MGVKVQWYALNKNYNTVESVLLVLVHSPSFRTLFPVLYQSDMSSEPSNKVFPPKFCFFLSTERSCFEELITISLVRRPDSSLYHLTLLQCSSISSSIVSIWHMTCKEFSSCICWLREQICWRCFLLLWTNTWQGNLKGEGIIFTHSFRPSW